jgi:RHS repeat-associated protein
VATTLWQEVQPSAGDFEQSKGDVAAVHPSLDGVVEDSAGKLTAIWGFTNESNETVVVPIGAANQMSPPPAARGQIIAFTPGIHHGAFSTPMNLGEPLVWTLGARQMNAGPNSNRLVLTPGPNGLGVSIGGRFYLIAPDLSPTVVPSHETSPGSHLTVGATPGVFAVTADGAASYRIPIWTPKGVGGIEPDLAITYNSNLGATGTLGVGWQLSGFGISQISRCRRTIAQDREAAGIRLDPTAPDALCLDGQRLIQVGTNTNEFRTERDIVAKIVLSGSLAVPNSFQVFLKDGRILEYGTDLPVHDDDDVDNAILAGYRRHWTAQPDVDNEPVIGGTENVRYAWALSIARDRSGNQMHVHYRHNVRTDARGETYVEMAIDEIRYAFEGDQPERSVRFAYENDPSNHRFGFVGGLPVATTERLKSIDVYGPTPRSQGLLRTYKLSYLGQAPVSGRTLLQSVQECDGFGICKAPTSFAWDTGSWSYENIPLFDTTDVGSSLLTPPPWKLFPCDINGDGKDDIVYLAPPSVPQPQVGYWTWTYRLSTGSGYGPPSTFKLDGEPLLFFNNETLRPLDVDLDGRSEIAIISHGGSTMTLYRLDGSELRPLESGSDDIDARGLYIGDMSGDGLPEVVSRVGNLWGLKENHAGRMYAFQTYFEDVPLGSGFTRVSYSALDLDNAYFADIDGSGRNSLLFRGRSLLTPPDPNGSKRYLAAAVRPFVLELSDSGITQPTTLRVATKTSDGFHYFLIDVNGDGQADAVRIPNSGGGASISLNTGAAQFESVRSGGGDLLPEHQFLSVMNTLPTGPDDLTIDTGVRVGDLNEDGLPDLILMGSDASDRIISYLSHGSGTFHIEGGEHLRASSSPIPIGVAARVLPSNNRLVGYPTSQVLDVNGDGLVDLLQLHADGNGGQNILHLYLRQGNKADQITMITDGLGKTDLVGYKPASDASVYAPANTCALPQFCTHKGMWLVASHRVSNDSFSPSLLQSWPTSLDLGQLGPALVSANLSSFVDPSLLDAFLTLIQQVQSQFNETRYKYFDGRSDLLGRGWLGFAHTQALQCLSPTACSPVDSATLADTFYDNVTRLELGDRYWKAGLPASQSVTTPLQKDGILFHRVVTTFDYEIRGAETPTYAARQKVKRVEESDSTAGGPGLFRTVTTNFSYETNDFDNLSEVTTSTTDGHLQRRVLTYDHDPTNWLVAKLRKIIDTSQVMSPASASGTTETTARTTTYDPDPVTGLLSRQVIEPDGGAEVHVTTELGRDRRGQIVRITSSAQDPLSSEPTTREQRITYDDLGGVYPTTVTNSLGQTRGQIYHAGLGVVGIEQDPNHVSVVYHYDGFGRLVSEKADGQGAVSVFYLSPDDPSASMRIFTQRAGGRDSVLILNHIGHEIQSGTRVFDGRFNIVDTRYGFLAGRVEGVSRPYFPGEEPFLTTFEYDNLGRVRTVTSADQAKSTASYVGLSTSYSDQVQNREVVVRDQIDQVVETERFSSPSAGAVRTLLRYGPFSTLVRSSVLAPGATGNGLTLSSMTYDVLARRKTIADADAGKTSVTYNAFGDVRSQIDANGSPSTYVVDALGRPLATVDGDGVTRQTWDTASNGVGKLASTRSPGRVRTDYLYTGDGFLSRATWQLESEAYSIEQNYDEFGRVKELAYPNVALAERFRVAYSYDMAGETNAIYDMQGMPAGSSPGGVPFWKATSRNSASQITGEVYANGIETAREYTLERGFLASIHTRFNVPNVPTALQALNYTYWPDGNIKTRQDDVANTSEQFEYDGIDQLCRWSFNSPSSAWRIRYDHDHLGNVVLKKPEMGSGVQTLTYKYGGPRPHAVTTVNGSAYHYDSKGNQIDGPGRTVAYTTFDLPSTVTRSSESTHFLYDAFGARFAKESSNARTLSVSRLYEKRTDKQSGNVTHVFFIEAGGRVVGQVNQDGSAPGTTLYLHDDHLGSVESVTDSLGLRVGSAIKFDPYGRRMGKNPSEVGQPPGNVHQGFTFHEHDDDLGLINMKGRIYAPDTGTFLTPDPLVQNLHSGNSYNHYAYAFNNPVNIIDPSGFQPQGCTSNCGGQGGAYVAVPPYASRTSVNGVNTVVFSFDSPGPTTPSGPPTAIGSGADSARAAEAGGGAYGAMQAGQGQQQAGAQSSMNIGGPNGLPQGRIADDSGPSAASVVHAGLLALSFVPGPVGTVAGLASAGLSLYQGDYVGAALSLGAALLPVAGAAIAAEVKAARAAKGVGAVAKGAGIFGKSTVGAGAVRVLQTGGNKIAGSTAAALNESTGLSLAAREWGRALEALKRSEGFANDFHGAIDSLGNYIHPETGQVIGNLLDFVP